MGEQVMSHEVISMFEEILSEVNWADERDEQISNARRHDLHAADSVESNVKEDVDDESKDKEDDSGEEQVEDSDVEEDDKAAPGELKIEDALEYSKLKALLNQFRASRSFKDPEVNVELKKYFKRLSNAEKKILYVLIKGLTQVTLLDISGKTAFTPADKSISVSITGSTSEEKDASKERAQQLTKDEDSEEEINKITNTPIKTVKIGGTKRSDEALQEIYNIVKSNA